MILDIDAGNSRVKWRLHSRQGYIEQGSFSSTEFSEEAFQDIEKHLVKNVRLASVAAAELNAFLKSRVALLWGVGCSQVATHNQGLVKVAYGDPSSLGVDRWLAMLAAYNAANSPVLVVDCGTAMTLDVVDSAGMHLGGYIVPGLATMRRALNLSTGHVRVESNILSENMCLGRSTVDAVNSGILLETVSFVERVYQMSLERCGGILEVYLTGGDATMISQYLGVSFCLKPDLVLDGIPFACIGES